MEISSRPSPGGTAGRGVSTMGGARAPGASDHPDIDSHRRLIAAVRAGVHEVPGLIDRLFPHLKSGHETWEPPARRTGPTPGTATWGSILTHDSATVWGTDFLFVTACPDPVTITIDARPPMPMTRVPGTPYWTYLDQLRLGATHNFIYRAGDRTLGHSTVAGYTMGSYPRPGVAPGTLSPMRSVASRIYGGAESDYWLYANAGIDPDRGAPLMVWFDGADHVGDAGWRGLRLPTVTDGLVHDKVIPAMVHLLIQPGRGGTPQAEQFPGQPQDNAMRSLQYDTVSEAFGRHLLEEVTPAVEAEYKLRPDAYSRGLSGHSSGGIASFNAAWMRPDAFARAMPANGSFVALQWHRDRHQDGGNILPSLVRREPRKNIRVWMSAGTNDLDIDAEGRQDIYAAGSWALANLSMAQALKTRGYDFHFRFGNGYHNHAQQALDLPEALAWLWRDYDPARDAQMFEQEERERRQPIYRFKVANREAW